jgi:hypothetical protein
LISKACDGAFFFKARNFINILKCVFGLQKKWKSRSCSQKKSPKSVSVAKSACALVASCALWLPCAAVGDKKKDLYPVI